MQVARTIVDCRNAIAIARRDGRVVRFVPTMGALHPGHTSLMAPARETNVFLVVSIFVNPTQFGPNEDFSRYPRDEEGDLAMCRAAGVDLVFAPDVAEMYGTTPSAPSLTTIRVAKLTDTLCGPFRPGHFDAVAKVVAKLFNIVQPDAAYFGEKDYQQLAVIRRVVRDLNMPIEIIGRPTVREPDGLAMSSRNRYLAPAERSQAASLYRGLQAGAAAISTGERVPSAVIDVIRAVIDAAGPARTDYISVIDPEMLQPVEQVDGPVQLALAVRIGRTRLIDNMRVDPRLRKP